LNKYLKIFFCLLSAMIIFTSENLKRFDEILDRSDFSSYTFVTLVFVAVFYLQKQLYFYLIPVKVRDRFLQPPEMHYRKGIFTGCIGLGYVLVLLHSFTLYSDVANVGGYLYIGLILIFLGVLSEVKGVIESEFLNDANS